MESLKSGDGVNMDLSTLFDVIYDIKDIKQDEDMEDLLWTKMPCIQHIYKYHRKEAQMLIDLAKSLDELNRRHNRLLRLNSQIKALKHDSDFLNKKQWYARRDYSNLRQFVNKLTGGFECLPCGYIMQRRNLGCCSITAQKCCGFGCYKFIKFISKR